MFFYQTCDLIIENRVYSMRLIISCLDLIFDLSKRDHYVRGKINMFKRVLATNKKDN